MTLGAFLPLPLLGQSGLLRLLWLWARLAFCPLHELLLAPPDHCSNHSLRPWSHAAVTVTQADVCPAGDSVTLQSCSVVTFVPPFLRGPLLESPHCRVAWALSVAIPHLSESGFLTPDTQTPPFPGWSSPMALQFFLAFVLHCLSPSRPIRPPLSMGWNSFPR